MKNVQVVEFAAQFIFLMTKFCIPSPAILRLTFIAALKAFPDFALTDLWL
jgi:hypothetical protein